MYREGQNIIIGYQFATQKYHAIILEFIMSNPDNLF